MDTGAIRRALRQPSEEPVPTRNVVLTEPRHEFVEALVRSGRYQNASEDCGWSLGRPKPASAQQLR